MLSLNQNYLQLYTRELFLGYLIEFSTKLRFLFATRWAFSTCLVILRRNLQYVYKQQLHTHALQYAEENTQLFNFFT